jgi:hypothetical protein
MSLSYKPVRSLLQTGEKASSRWLSYTGLCVGIILLFCSLQMLVNIQRLLKGNIIRKNGYDYISVIKKVPLDTAVDPENSFFIQREIDEIRSGPSVADVAALVTTQFQVDILVPGVFTTPTSLYVESLRKDFIDTVPEGFSWKPVQDTVPLIISSQFFEVFNALARSNGFYQITPELAPSINIKLICHGANDSAITFNARCIAFSDRINTALVPEEFMRWANEKFAGRQADHFSRVYLKTKNADDEKLMGFLIGKNYRVNKDKTKLGAARQVLDGIFVALAVFGLLIVALALMLFSFYLQLVIAKSRESLQLLITIGYSPKWLGKNLSRRFIPTYALIILFALGITELMQWVFHHDLMYDRPELSSIVDQSVLLAAIILLTLSVVTNYQLVKKLLGKLS